MSENKNKPEIEIEIDELSEISLELFEKEAENKPKHLKIEKRPFPFKPSVFMPKTKKFYNIDYSSRKSTLKGCKKLASKKSMKIKSLEHKKKTLSKSLQIKIINEEEYKAIFKIYQNKEKDILKCLRYCARVKNYLAKLSFCRIC